MNTMSIAKETTWSAELVWAAAARACRINNDEYLRHNEWVEDPVRPGSVVPGRNASKTIMLESLKDNVQPTDADFENGREARSYFLKHYTFRILKAELNGFESRLVQCLSQESFNTQHGTELTIIASQVPRWKNSVEEDKLMQGASTAPLAKVGDRISRKITVIRTVWSEKYQLHFITARTECNHVVFFAYKNRMQRGQTCAINGTVKTHRTDSTQLNRVKVFDL